MIDLFKQQIWEITKLIPKGRVSSYGAIAKAVGFPNHSRHVGKAMGGCPKDIPAHRVISSSGVLSVPEFQAKLEAEGIEVVNLRIKNLYESQNNVLKEFDNDGNGEIDIVDGTDFNNLLKKHQVKPRNYG